MIALFQGHLHTDHDCLLSDVEVAEAADKTHSVELAGFFLESPDEEHRLIGVQILLACEAGA